MNKDEKELILMAKLTIIAAMALLGTAAGSNSPVDTSKQDAVNAAVQDHLTKLDNEEITDEAAIDQHQQAFQAFTDAYNVAKGNSSSSGASSTSGASSSASGAASKTGSSSASGASSTSGKSSS